MTQPSYRDESHWPKVFMSWGANPLLKDPSGCLPSHHLVAIGNVGDFEHLLKIVEQKQDLEQRRMFLEEADIHGNSPSHLAACFKKIKMLEYLLSKGVNLNAFNNEGKSPLHIVLQSIEDGFEDIAHTNLALKMMDSFDLITASRNESESIFDIITNHPKFKKFPFNALRQHPKIVEESKKREMEQKVRVEAQIAEMARQVEESRLLAARQEEERIARELQEVRLLESQRESRESEAMNSQDINIAAWEYEPYLERGERFDVKKYIANRNRERKVEESNRLEMQREDLLSKDAQEQEDQFLIEARDLETWRLKEQEYAAKQEEIAKQLEQEEARKKAAALKKQKDAEKKRLAKEAARLAAQEEERMIVEAIEFRKRFEGFDPRVIRAVDLLRAVIVDETRSLKEIGDFVHKNFNHLNVVDQRRVIGEFSDNPKFMHALVADLNLKNFNVFVALVRADNVNLKYDGNSILSSHLNSHPKSRDPIDVMIHGDRSSSDLIGFCRLLNFAGAELSDSEINSVSKIVKESGLTKDNVGTVVAKRAAGLAIGANLSHDFDLLTFSSLSISQAAVGHIIEYALKNNQQHKIELFRILRGSKEIEGFLEAGLSKLGGKVDDSMKKYLASCKSPDLSEPSSSGVVSASASGVVVIKKGK